MGKSFASRLVIPLVGNNTLSFYTRSGLLVAVGYVRVVIGKRGPYIEFASTQIKLSSFYIPEEQVYRLTSNVVYYVEYRSIDTEYIKLYLQKKTVAYADYMISRFYISPFDLKLPGNWDVIK